MLELGAPTNEDSRLVIHVITFKVTQPKYIVYVEIMLHKLHFTVKKYLCFLDQVKYDNTRLKFSNIDQMSTRPTMSGG